MLKEQLNSSKTTLELIIALKTTLIKALFFIKVVTSFLNTKFIDWSG